MVKIRPIEPLLRQALEKNGGTKKSKEAIGNQFVNLVEDSDKNFLNSPATAPAWWVSPGDSSPRTIDQIVESSPEVQRMLGEFWREFIWGMRVKNKDGKEDYPFFNTAQVTRSHIKMFCLEKYKLDLTDKKIFRDREPWWKSYQVC